MGYNLKWLIEKAHSGERLKYLFFWGHQPERDGTIGKGCLSQWWDGHPFEVDGIRYLSAEHWMMAGKARVFGDDEMLEQILASQKPAEAKALGRKVRGFDKEVWAAHGFPLVVEGNVHKFGQHPDLKAYLLASGDRIIVEASPRDRIWGIGMGASNPKAEHPEQWRGQNLLGFALMECRDVLK